MIGRRLVLAGGLALPLAAPSAAAARPAVLWEWTFLASLDANPADLIAFIKANWFAMDAIAVERGLFSDFALYRADDAGDWQVAVVVGYPDPRGYDGVRDGFEVIRKAHRPVLVNGKDLKALGRVIGTRRVVRA